MAAVCRQSLTAQSVNTVTVYPTAYQTPNGPGTQSISASNTDGSGSISVTASSATATCRWYGFPNVPGQIVSVRLKMGWSASGSVNGPMGGGGGFSLNAMGGGASIGGSSFSQSSSRRRCATEQSGSNAGSGEYEPKRRSRTEHHF